MIAETKKPRFPFKIILRQIGMTQDYIYKNCGAPHKDVLNWFNGRAEMPPQMVTWLHAMVAHKAIQPPLPNMARLRKKREISTTRRLHRKREL